jgi:hypothetical protein
MLGTTYAQLHHDNPKLDKLLVDSMLAMCAQMMAMAVAFLGIVWFAPRRALGPMGAACKWGYLGTVLLRHCVRLRSIRREGHIHGCGHGFGVRDSSCRGRRPDARYVARKRQVTYERQLTFHPP